MKDYYFDIHLTNDGTYNKVTIDFNLRYCSENNHNPVMVVYDYNVGSAGEIAYDTYNGEKEIEKYKIYQTD